MNNPRVFISAGELSGDIVGARLVAELRRRDPSTHFAGTGGARLAAAGVEIIHDTNEIGVVGVTEVAKTAPAVFAAYRAIRRQLRRSRFDVAVLIGNDVFNTFLGRWLRRRGIPTLSYFPPQPWVWRSLARWMAPSFDAIAASFPDEQEVYARAGAHRPVRFVGHYLADDLQPVNHDTRQAARRALELPADSRVVALLPGSRGDELAALTQVLLDAAGRLADRDPSLRFVAANAVGTPRLPDAISRHAIAARTSVSADSHTVIRSADLVLIASGTASLEAALLGVPMVIVYKLSAITNLVVRAAIALGLIEAYVVGLPNLLLRRNVVPEVLQERATAAIVADEAWSCLSNPDRLRRMQAELAPIAGMLSGPQSIAQVADMVRACAASNAAAARRSHWPVTPAPAVSTVERD
jgi:lipid-A-disaccharide synthase